MPLDQCLHDTAHRLIVDKIPGLNRAGSPVETRRRFGLRGGIASPDHVADVYPPSSLRTSTAS